MDSIEIQSHLKCHAVTARILWNRGYRTKESLDSLFHPDLKKLPNPFSLHQMDIAVETILSSIDSSKKITIYGDYDVDGTCGASLLFDFFRKINYPVDVFQPNRFKDGYGLHSHCVQSLADSGTKVLIAVDCGITAVEAANTAKNCGIELIILDHHKVGDSLPNARAIVNPQKEEDHSGLKTLCGTGIAFFFILALRSRLRENNYFKQSIKEPNLLQFLDLVCIATIADMMDVRDINRTLIIHGLRVLEKTTRPGLRAMMKMASIEKPTAMHCGFVFGPRINAAGRLQHARAALDLLTTENENEANKLCEALEDLNLERRKTQDTVVEEALAMAEKEINNEKWKLLSDEIPAVKMAVEENLFPRAIVLHNEKWHEGVLGIVASKVVEKYKRPVFVLSKKEDTKESIFKGSIRSYAKVDIIQNISVESVSRHLLNYGGHAHAGGVTLLESELESFKMTINIHLALSTTKEDYIKTNPADVDVELSEIDGKLANELEQLAPFGIGFTEPVLRVKAAQAKTVKIMKEKHLKITFTPPTSTFATTTDALWFNVTKAKEKAEKIKQGLSSNFHVTTQWNEWNGNKKLQLMIQEMNLD